VAQAPVVQAPVAPGELKRATQVAAGAVTALFPDPTGAGANVQRAIAASRASVLLPGVAVELPGVVAEVEEAPVAAAGGAGADAGKHVRG
jgi:hypothetical protein